MLITSLCLKGFRNIDELVIEPAAGVNLLVGANAQGKTNIIEAIGLVSTGSSFRTPEFRDMIGWNATRAEVSAEVSGGIGIDRLSVSMDNARKGFHKNGKKTQIRGPAVLQSVLFAPEEIMLLRSSPGARRRHIDSFISQMTSSHRSDVSKYEKVIRHRNRILSDADRSRAQKTRELEPWNDQLADLGARIIVTRKTWIERLNERLPDKYVSMAPEDGPAEFSYQPHCGADLMRTNEPRIKEGLVKQIETRREDEFARCTSLVGPHRDDIEARIGDASVKGFGSQGQHRSFVLALKLSEMAMLADSTGEKPVLLLDDVASELDRERNRLFFEAIAANMGQVFVTATAEEDVRSISRNLLHVFTVREGKAVARKQL